jgi:hypothetical protein
MCLNVTDKTRYTATEDIVVYKELKSKFNNTLHGKRFKGIINNIECKGKISINADGDLFFCTNKSELNGTPTYNRFIYKYSWIIDRNLDINSIIVDTIPITKHITKCITPYRGVTVKLGKTYTSNLVLNITNYIATVDIGIHSYKNIPNILDNPILVKCIIPKGADYYVGEFNYVDCYASTKLKYIEMIN